MPDVWSGSGTAYWANVTMPPAVVAATERVLARVRRNIAEALPLDAGADPIGTCAELGVTVDESGARALDALEAA